MGVYRDGGGSVDCWMAGCTDGWMYGDGPVGGCIYGWMGGWLGGWMNVWMHGCMDGWVDGTVYGSLVCIIRTWRFPHLATRKYISSRLRADEGNLFMYLIPPHPPANRECPTPRLAVYRFAGSVRNSMKSGTSSEHVQETEHPAKMHRTARKVKHERTITEHRKSDEHSPSIEHPTNINRKRARI